MRLKLKIVADGPGFRVKNGVMRLTLRRPSFSDEYLHLAILLHKSFSGLEKQLSFHLEHQSGERHDLAPVIAARGILEQIINPHPTKPEPLNLFCPVEYLSGLSAAVEIIKDKFCGVEFLRPLLDDLNAQIQALKHFHIATIERLEKAIFDLDGDSPINISPHDDGSEWSDADRRLIEVVQSINHLCQTQYVHQAFVAASMDIRSKMDVNLYSSAIAHMKSVLRALRLITPISRSPGYRIMALSLYIEARKLEQELIREMESLNLLNGESPLG